MSQVQRSDEVGLLKFYFSVMQKSTRVVSHVVAGKQLVQQFLVSTKQRGRELIPQMDDGADDKEILRIVVCLALAEQLNIKEMMMTGIHTSCVICLDIFNA